MTYRGIVSNGVVVLEGQKPLEGTIVEVTPLREISSQPSTFASHPALGMWKDRTDFPNDAVEASKVLRKRLMDRAGE